MKAKLFILIIFLFSIKIFSEGSFDINKNNKYRVYSIISQKRSIDFEPFTGVYFYAKKGEKVLIGASLFDGPDNYDVIIASPDNKIIHLDIDKKGKGLIDTVKKEINGPYPDKDGYEPLIYYPNKDGVYKVEFNCNYENTEVFSVVKMSEKFPIGTINKRASNNGTNSFFGVSSWDITVISINGLEVKGRVFLYNLQCYLDAEIIDSIKLYMLSKDGYIYQIEAEKFQPHRFDFYCVNRGIINSEHDTLYHSITYMDNKLEAAGIVRQHPLSADTETDITHYLFLNMPSNDLPAYMPVKAIEPPMPSNFKFTGIIENKTVEDNGGIFKFNSTINSTYKLIIDSSGPDKKPDGVFDQYDIIIENICSKGENKIYWDGKDKNGNYLKSNIDNKPYYAELILKGSEFHFPMIDVEDLNKGIKIKLLNPPFIPENWSPNFIYYNDDDFNLNGIKFDLGSGITSFNNSSYITKPSNPRSALGGIDSSNGAHAFGNNYGDRKIIDTWTYFPSKKIKTSFYIIQKKDEQAVQEKRKIENLVNLEKAKEGDVIYFNDIMFYSDSSKIREESFKTLDDVALIIQKRSEIIIQISGYTNSIGNPQGELKLSNERANSVMKYFIIKGINSTRIKAKGYGSLNLKESRVSDANRRVEIKIIGILK